MIKQTLDLNLIPGRVLPRVNVSQYDKGTRTLEFTIYNGEILFNPTGYTAYIQGQKPDGHGFNYAATIANQKISVDVVEQMTAVAGSVACEIVIQDGTDQIGTGNFILQVEAAALPDGATMSESDYNIIQKAVEDAQAAAEEAKEASANTPYIGQNGNWYVYDADTKQYIDTGVEAEGPEGPTGPTGNGIASITKTGTVGMVDTYTITFTDGTTTTFTVTNGEDAVTTVEQDDSLALAPTSAGNALPITIYGQSTQNGTPTPSAPVAIESASADFKCVGKNLIPYPYIDTTKTSGTLTFTDNGDGTITLSGTTGSSGVAFYIYSKASKTFLSDGNYVVSFEGDTAGVQLSLEKWLDNTKVGTTIAVNATEVSLTQDDTYNHLYTYLWVSANADFTTPVTVKPMIRLASVADATYEPYKHTDITTNLTLRAIEVTSSDPYNLVKDGKYYIADTIDWDEVDGYTLTKRIEEFEVDGTENGWSYTSTTGEERFAIRYDTSLGYGIIGVKPENAKCNHFVYSSNRAATWGHFRLSNDGWLIIQNNDTVIASVNDFKTWLGNNNTTFMYILATPTKTSLTSAQAKALLSMRTYDESTSIDAVNSPAPVLELEYAKTRTPALALTGHNMAHINAIDIGDM